MVLSLFRMSNSLDLFRLHVLTGLIWVQNVTNGNQQAMKVATIRERIISKYRSTLH